MHSDAANFVKISHERIAQSDGHTIKNLPNGFFCYRHNNTILKTSFISRQLLAKHNGSAILYVNEYLLHCDIWICKCVQPGKANIYQVATQQHIWYIIIFFRPLYCIFTFVIVSTCCTARNLLFCCEFGQQWVCVSNYHRCVMAGYMDGRCIWTTFIHCLFRSWSGPCHFAYSHHTIDVGWRFLCAFIECTGFF